MGYTHYAYIPAGIIDDYDWANLQNQILLLTVDEEWKDKHVVLSKDYIQVQGNHEWFSIPRDCSNGSFRTEDKYFTFTKTARKDYDYIIVACYMALSRCIRGVELLSDGGYDELAQGRNYYRDVFGLNDNTLNFVFRNTIHDGRNINAEQ